MSTVARADRDERPTFESVADDIGEDPARFLSAASKDLPLARIRGLETIAACNAWTAVERRAWGGRDVVLDAIETRRQELQATDERGDLRPQVRMAAWDAARLQEVVGRE